jgi:Zn-dependent protease
MLSDLFSALASGDSTLIGSALIIFLFYLIAILLSLSVHESAHGFVADKCGDPTAKNFGRITLNPIKHIDPFGFVCMMIAGFGWAKPVPVNSRNFNKPRRDMALVALAGPVSNLLVATIFVAIWRFTYFPLAQMILRYSAAGDTFMYMLASSIRQFIIIMITMNVTLAIFNLIPVPPLDGSKILYTLLTPKVYYKIAPYEKYVYIVMIILLVTDIITPVISFISGHVVNVLLSLFFW